MKLTSQQVLEIARLAQEKGEKPDLRGHDLSGVS